MMCPKLYTHYLPTLNYLQINIIYPTFQIRKWRLGKAKYLTQDHTVNKAPNKIWTQFCQIQNSIIADTSAARHLEETKSFFVAWTDLLIIYTAWPGRGDQLSAHSNLLCFLLYPCLSQSQFLCLQCPSLSLFLFSFQELVLALLS